MKDKIFERQEKIEFEKFLYQYCTTSNLYEHKKVTKFPKDYYLKLAIYYASKGFFVFPVSPSKIPYKGFHWNTMASNDPAVIREYWKKYPYGRPAFFASKSGLFVIDIDNKPQNGKFGLEVFQKLTKKLGKLSKTIMVYSQSGGVHIYLLNPNMQTIRNEKSEDRIGEKVSIDFQNNHFCLCGGVFNNEGRCYRFVEGYTFKDVEIAPLPETWKNYLYKSENCEKKKTFQKNQKTFELEGDIKTWAEECPFISYCIKESQSLSEFHWFQLGTIFGELQNGEKWFDLFSQSHPDYDPIKVKNKFLNCQKYSACKCETIAGDFDGCKECKHYKGE